MLSISWEGGCCAARGGGEFPERPPPPPPPLQPPAFRGVVAALERRCAAQEEQLAAQARRMEELEREAVRGRHRLREMAEALQVCGRGRPLVGRVRPLGWTHSDERLRGGGAVL